MSSRCALCDAVDEDTDLGWTICGSCFHSAETDVYPAPAWERRVKLGCAVALMAAFMFLFAAMVELKANASPDTNPATTPPLPPLPTQILNGDGSRMNCTPNLNYCWKAP